MVWANALVLGLGGLLLTIPIILHFLMQPKPKVLMFPALRFIRERQMSNRSRMRLRHVLLLLLRCLLILLMAAALAGPTVASREFGQWLTVGGIGVLALVLAFTLAAAWFVARKRSMLLVGILGLLLVGNLVYGGYATIKLLNSESAQLIGDSQAPVTALILIDSSCRMSYLFENRENLDRAKEIGNWLLEQFPSDSQVCVLATDGQQPFFSVDLGAAKNRIDNLRVNYLSSFIPQSLAAGLQLLNQAIHERKEIYILTDLTRRSWNGGDANLVLKKLEDDPATSLFVIDVGVETPTNFMLSPINLSADTITQTGQVELTSSIQRLGNAAQRNVRMSIEKPDPTRPVIRDKQVLLPDKFWERTQTVDIQQGSVTPFKFQFAETLPLGTHHGQLELIGGDSLAIDDVRYFTVEVREAWKVLILYPQGVNPGNLYDAISPPRQRDAGTSLYDVTLADQNEIASLMLDQFQAVFLLNPTPISDTTWVRLEQYVSQGHGLGIFLGNNAASGPFADESFTTPAAQKVLTGKLSRQWRRKRELADLFLSPDNLSHDILAPFRSWEEAVPWNRFPIFIHWGIEPDDDQPGVTTQTVMKYGNGQPAIINRTIGDGRIIIMTTSITESAGEQAWNELFIGYSLPAWLLVRQISQYLVQSQSDQLNLVVGATATLRNDPRQFPEQYRIFTPRTEQTPAQVTAVDGRIRYRFTETPGNYRLKGNREGRPVLRGFSVNLNEAETDLSRMTQSEVDSMLGRGRYQLAKKKDEIQRQQGTTRRGKEFYPLLLIMVAVIMGVEYLMSNRFYAS